MALIILFIARFLVLLAKRNIVLPIFWTNFFLLFLVNFNKVLTNNLMPRLIVFCFIKLRFEFVISVDGDLLALLTFMVQLNPADKLIYLS